MGSTLAPEEPTCDICYLGFDLERFPLQLGCGHSFCRPCITRIVRSSCPTCRTALGPSPLLGARPNYALFRHSALMTEGGVGAEGKASPAFSIYIKTLTGKSVRVEIRATDSVSKLKNIISMMEGIQPEEQRLIFAGKELDAMGKATLGECGIKPEYCIHVVMRLRGGSGEASA